MKHPSDKNLEILQRRKKVYHLFSTTTGLEMAKILGVCKSTIDRDMRSIRKGVHVWMDTLPKDEFILQYKLTLDGSKSRSVILKNMLETTLDDFEKLAIIKELRNEEKFYIDLLSQAPTIHSLREIVRDGNV